MSVKVLARYVSLPKLTIPIQAMGGAGDGRTKSIVRGAYHPDVVSSAKNLSSFGAASPEWISAIGRFESHAQRYLRYQTVDNYIFGVLFFELASNMFWHSRGGKLEAQFTRTPEHINLEISATSRGSMPFDNLMLDGWQTDVDIQRGKGLFSIISFSDEFSLLSEKGRGSLTIVKSTVYDIPHELRPPEILSLTVPLSESSHDKAFDVRLAGWFETVHSNRERLRLLSMDTGPVGRYAEWVLSQIPKRGIRD
ncbi:MAG: hypothetical protein AABZ57_05945 [Candidatus Margulisiibacteriota bacterium]